MGNKAEIIFWWNRFEVVCRTVFRKILRIFEEKNSVGVIFSVKHYFKFSLYPQLQMDVFKNYLMFLRTIFYVIHFLNDRLLQKIFPNIRDL